MKDNFCLEDNSKCVGMFLPNSETGRFNAWKKEVLSNQTSAEEERSHSACASPPRPAQPQLHLLTASEGGHHLLSPVCHLLSPFPICFYCSHLLFTWFPPALTCSRLFFQLFSPAFTPVLISFYLVLPSLLVRTQHMTKTSYMEKCTLKKKRSLSLLILKYSKHFSCKLSDIKPNVFSISFVWIQLISYSK